MIQLKLVPCVPVLCIPTGFYRAHRKHIGKVHQGQIIKLFTTFYVTDVTSPPLPISGARGHQAAGPSLRTPVTIITSMSTSWDSPGLYDLIDCLSYICHFLSFFPMSAFMSFCYPCPSFWSPCPDAVLPDAVLCFVIQLEVYMHLSQIHFNSVFHNSWHVILVKNSLS